MSGLRSHFGVKGAVVLALTLGVLGCTNNSIRNLNSGGGTTAGGGGGGGGGSAFSLVNVVRSTQNPGSELDLVGDGTGQFAQFCTTTGSTATNTGPSTCECDYEYTQSTTSFRIQEPTVRFERDMLRCGFTTVPATVATINVRIHHIPTDSYSNLVVFNAAGTGNVANLTNADSFIQVKRYQAKDHIFISHMFTPSLYDPIQSEDSRLTWPLNFYFSNPGGTIIFFGAESGNNPDLSKFDLGLDENNLPSWTNLNIYSVGAGSGGSKRIYPTTGSAFDRYTFYGLRMNRGPAGAFTEPINGFAAPTIVTTSPGTGGAQPPNTMPSFGYGAKSIPTPTGETCPTNVTIPAGFQWVKLWAFRGTIAPRRHVQTTQEIVDIGQIACNPGRFIGPNNVALNPANDEPVFRDCEIPGNTGNEFPLATPNVRGLAARVLGDSGVCVKMAEDTNGVPALAAGDQGKAGLAGPLFPTTYPNGPDLWERVGDVSIATSKVPFDLDTPDREPNGAGSCTFFDSANNCQSVPKDNQIFLDDSLDSGNARFNYLFVVSPISINKDTMKNQLAGYEPFHPYTYKRKEDCNALDPDANATCIANAHQKIPYGLWSSEISADPNANPEGTTFPMCVLQPI